MAATLHFFCPTTRQQVPTDIKTDVQGLSASWRSIVNRQMAFRRCRYCRPLSQLCGEARTRTGGGD